MFTDENANPDPNNDADSDDPGREGQEPLSPDEYAEAQKDARREGSGA